MQGVPNEIECSFVRQACEGGKHTTRIGAGAGVETFRPQEAFKRRCQGCEPGSHPCCPEGGGWLDSIAHAGAGEARQGPQGPAGARQFHHA